jgi:CheY-like chemotaxis protein
MEDHLGRVRVLLAEDHGLVAEAFEKLLEPEFHVVGMVGDGQSLLRMARERKLVLLDLYMPGGGGLAAGEVLKRSMPRIKIGRPGRVGVQAGARADDAAAAGAEAVGRRMHDEGGGGDLARDGAHSGVSQVQDHAGVWNEDKYAVGAVCDEGESGGRLTGPCSSA